MLFNCCGEILPSLTSKAAENNSLVFSFIDRSFESEYDILLVLNSDCREAVKKRLRGKRVPGIIHELSVYEITIDKRAFPILSLSKVPNPENY